MKYALLRNVVFTLNVVGRGPGMWVEEYKYHQSHDWVAGRCIGRTQDRKKGKPVRRLRIIQGKCS